MCILSLKYNSVLTSHVSMFHSHMWPGATVLDSVVILNDSECDGINHFSLPKSQAYSQTTCKQQRLCLRPSGDPQMEVGEALS